MRIIFYSQTDPYGLAASYMRAATQLGIEYKFFDYTKSLRKHMPFGKLGYRMQQYLFIETLNHKINRDFVIEAKNFRPAAIFFFTNAPVSAGALIFIKSILPECKLVMIWPDALLNITQIAFNNLQLLDFIGTYSSTSVEILRKITNARVEFIPLAGDPEIHLNEPSNEFKIDFGFIGGWRPERQHYMEAIAENFKDRVIEIHGPYWKEKCKGSMIGKKVVSDGLHGKKMADFFAATRININIIDDTNFPAANMRFFEIMTAGGLELVSSCPEMEAIFSDGTDLFYFSDADSLIEKSRIILNMDKRTAEIRHSGHQKTLSEHTYVKRLDRVIKLLS